MNSRPDSQPHVESEPDRPLIYIAAPYTLDDTAENVPGGVHFAEQLMDNGLCWPVVPYLTLLWHLISPRPYKDWMALDAAILRRCDGLIRLPGESVGADAEVELALSLGLPTYRIGGTGSLSSPELEQWLRQVVVVREVRP